MARFRSSWITGPIWPNNCRPHRRLRVVALDDPLYFNGLHTGGVEGMLMRFLWNVPLAFVFTWVHNRTRGSLLISILLHTSLNFQEDVSSIVLQTLVR